MYQSFPLSLKSQAMLVLIGKELLARWYHSDQEQILRGAFLPLCEVALFNRTAIFPEQTSQE
jgi:EAL domain-containing protein (putative c-di-GMP-specific phosphodiesterase class I)